ncbi:MAG: YeeE/YedE thiosulfate transporter family protein, partial [Chloroflexota bacterium]
LTGNFTLDAGVIAGAFVAAVLASEFKVRWPRQRRRYLQSAAGGIGMGYGAGLAVGCTIGAFFSAIPSLGLNGWIFGLSLLIGAFGGVKIIQRIP